MKKYILTSIISLLAFFATLSVTGEEFYEDFSGPNALDNWVVNSPAGSISIVDGAAVITDDSKKKLNTLQKNLTPILTPKITISFRFNADSSKKKSSNFSFKRSEDKILRLRVYKGEIYYFNPLNQWQLVEQKLMLLNKII